MICLQCNSQIEEDSLYCDQCGAEIFICELCGKPGNGKRCIHDGRLLISRKTATQTKDVVQSSSIEDPVIVQKELILQNRTVHLDLKINKEVVIGRVKGDFCDVLGKYSAISSKHAKISFNKEWQVCDLGSTNGTWLDEKQLDPNFPCRLNHGCKLRFADIEFLVILPEDNNNENASSTQRL